MIGALISSPRLVVLQLFLILTLGSSAAHAQAQNDAIVGLFGIFVLLTILLVIFFVPSIVAFARQHPNRWVILVINLVFGFTGLGWLGSLVWALNAVHRPASGGFGGASGLNIFTDDARPAYHPVVPALAQPALPLLANLARLKQLLDQGAIDQIEYEYLKYRLLSDHK